jgi:hypothetical protein
VHHVLIHAYHGVLGVELSRDGPIRRVSTSLCISRTCVLDKPGSFCTDFLLGLAHVGFAKQVHLMLRGRCVALAQTVPRPCGRVGLAVRYLGLLHLYVLLNGVDLVQLRLQVALSCHSADGLVICGYPTLLRSSACMRTC